MIFFTWWSKLDVYERVLLFLFLLSLPLVNPWVRGDGVGYYAYARALVVDHDLQFEKDWQHANPSFRNGRVDANGRIRPGQYTTTGHLDDHFAIGPALIWMPFLALAHGAVLLADRLGAHVSADGYSWPYLDTMAVVTTLCGFLALIISFRLAQKYFPRRWAFLAALGIWFASSLPVYMYFNPSWSHAQSAFIVALFVWYWDATRQARTWRQWLVLGLIGGLMMDIYYLNAILLLLVFVEVVSEVSARFRTATPTGSYLRQSARNYVLFAAVLVIAFSPTFVTRKIIYGSFFSTGYDANLWRPLDPSWGKILFSSDHGLFSWTPILLPSCIGLLFLWFRDRVLTSALAAAVAVFYFSIAIYANWDGISSYGNRFFVSLTVVFVLGLSALLSAHEKLWHSGKTAVAAAGMALALLAIWNLGLMFQWGMHLVPERGPISWREVATNQVHAVPAEIAGSLEQYFTGRHRLMQKIEKEDLRQLDEANTPDKPARPAQ